MVGYKATWSIVQKIGQHTHVKAHSGSVDSFGRQESCSRQPAKSGAAAAKSRRNAAIWRYRRSFKWWEETNKDLLTHAATLQVDACCSFGSAQISCVQLHSLELPLLLADPDRPLLPSLKRTSSLLISKMLAGAWPTASGCLSSASRSQVWRQAWADKTRRDVYAQVGVDQKVRNTWGDPSGTTKNDDSYH